MPGQLLAADPDGTPRARARGRHAPANLILPPLCTSGVINNLINPTLTYCVNQWHRLYINRTIQLVLIATHPPPLPWFTSFILSLDDAVIEINTANQSVFAGVASSRFTTHQSEPLIWNACMRILMMLHPPTSAYERLCAHLRHQSRFCIFTFS